MERQPSNAMCYTAKIVDRWKTMRYTTKLVGRFVELDESDDESKRCDHRRAS